jgi:hypothetical protein
MAIFMTPPGFIRYCRNWVFHPIGKTCSYVKPAEKNKDEEGGSSPYVIIKARPVPERGYMS